MYKISGKQRFGTVYRNGKCIATFRKGVGYTDNADDAEYLKEKGYTVEGDPAANADPLAGMTAKELTIYAVDHGIDLTSVPNQKGKILAAIRAVEPLPTTETGDEFPVVAQAVKLFLSPELTVPPGSKVVVRRSDREFTYTRSGEPGVFSNHQEILLTEFKGWA